jgi:hypothetical protein
MTGQPEVAYLRCHLETAQHARRVRNPSVWQVSNPPCQLPSFGLFSVAWRWSFPIGGPVRNVARIKLGYYPLPHAEGLRLRKLLVFEDGASAVDPCAGTGAALHQLTEGAKCLYLQASSAKVSVRSVSRLTALVPSTPVYLACSRPRSVPSSPVNSLDSSMFCTSILKSRSPKRTMQDCLPSSRRRVEVGPTSRSCFRWLEERGIMPQTLAFLTDLWGTFPSDVPPYPVLRASTGKRDVPFGQVIPMEAA